MILWMLPTNPHRPNRWSFLLIVATLVWSWLAMQAIHEFGHVVHAWGSQGQVRKVLLDPLQISRTDVDPNPHPRFVAWGGPVWGCLLPLSAWRLWREIAPSGAWWGRFFAGFCLIANGAYLLGGSMMPVGDAETLIRHGASHVSLIGFGIVTVTAGLGLWNGLGPRFGLGRHSVPVQAQTALRVVVLLGVTILAELLVTWAIP